MICKAPLQDKTLPCEVLFFSSFGWLLTRETSGLVVANQFFALTLAICRAHRSAAASVLSTDDARGAIDVTEEDAHPSSLTSLKGVGALGESCKALCLVSL